MNKLLFFILAIVFAFSTASAFVYITQGGTPGFTIHSPSLLAPSTTDPNQNIIGKANILTGEENFRVTLNDTGHLCYLYTSGGTPITQCGNTALSNNSWYNFSFSVDTTAGRILLYLNGTLDMNETYAGSPDTTSNPIRLGLSSDNTGQFTGGLDNIRIYNETLNASQIQIELGSPIEVSDAILAYDFEQGSPTSAFDTHFLKFNANNSIVMKTTMYDNSTQCVLYNAPGKEFIQNDVARDLLGNVAPIAGLLLLALAGGWIFFS